MGKKVKYNSRTYKDRAMEVASDFCPSMYQCSKCGSPVAEGYLCQFCGHDNSANRREEPESLNYILETIKG